MAMFTPSGDFESAVAQARRDVQHWRAARGKSDDWRNDPKWAEWAGDKLPEMMRDRELTIRSLDSPDVGIRLTAACLLAQYWPANERFAPHVLRVAFEDPAPAVRGAALYALCRVRRDVSDPTGFLQKLLAALFPPLPDDVRAKASSDVDDTRRRIDAGFTAMWDRKAGIHAARMRESRAAAESYLAHRDPQLRRTALSTLAHYWKPDKEFEEACEQMVFQDSDAEVRSLALACLACCYSGSDDPRVGRLAAQLVRDDTLPEKLRVAGYRALFTIRGMPSKWILSTCPSRSFRFPEDVDWAFVNTFLDRAE